MCLYEWAIDIYLLHVPSKIYHLKRLYNNVTDAQSREGRTHETNGYFGYLIDVIIEKKVVYQNASINFMTSTCKYLQHTLTSNLIH